MPGSRYIQTIDHIGDRHHYVVALASEGNKHLNKIHFNLKILNQKWDATVYENGWKEM